MDKVTETVQKMYTRYPWPDSHELFLKRRNHFKAHYLDFIFNSILKKPVKDAEVLEIGCGTGEKLGWCAYLYPEINFTAVDLSPKSIEKAKKFAEQNSITNITFIQMNVLNNEEIAKIPNGRFDVIVSDGVIHHLASPKQGLLNIIPKLSDQGIMSIGFYDKISRMELYHIHDIMNILVPDKGNFDDRFDYLKKLMKELEKSPRYDNVTQYYNNINQFYPDNAPQFYADTFLHVSDVGYTIPELYELLDSVDIELIEFIDESLWDTSNLFLDEVLKERYNQLSKFEKYRLAQLIIPERQFPGNFELYFYCCRKGRGIKPFEITKEQIYSLKPTLHSGMKFVSEVTYGRCQPHHESIKLRLLDHTISEIILSPIAYELLVRCDGSKTTTELFEELNTNITPLNETMKSQFIDILFDLQKKRFVFFKLT